MLTSKTEIPGFFCSDEEVQRFCERELWDIHAYSIPEFTKTASQIVDAAVARFGIWKCYDIEFWQH